MLTTLESGRLCPECFICIILFHTHNNPVRVVSISPVFQVKKLRHRETESLAHSHRSRQQWSRTRREESGTHRVKDRGSGCALPAVRGPVLTRELVAPAPRAACLGPKPCGVTGEQCRQLSFCWDPVGWRREEKCRNLEIFEFLLFRLNACLQSVGFIVECSLWSQD